MIPRSSVPWLRAISGQASDEVSLDPGATVKAYGLDSEVIYRDALNNEITSDPLKVNVNVVPSRNVIDMLGLSGLVVLIVIGILAALGYSYTQGGPGNSELPFFSGYGACKKGLL